jgi:hypothetical protein
VSKWEGYPVGGRTKLFLRNWRVLTNDPELLGTVSGYEIPLLENPNFLRGKKIKSLKFSEKENILVDQEVAKMLGKRAIRKTSPGDQVVSSLFLRDKADGGRRPIINLKRLNAVVPYVHFKMEGLRNLRDLLQPGDLLVKLDLKDAYFTVPLGRKSQGLVAFEWRAETYEFEVLCFGLGPAPRCFTKIMKVPLQWLRSLGIRLIAYLDDFLLMAQTMSEIIQARDSMIFLLEHLGFVLNHEKSVLEPSQQMRFLGVQINSVTMTLSVPEQKAQKLMDLCRWGKANPNMTALELSQIIGKLAATMPAVSYTMIHVRSLQRALRLSLQTNRSYGARVQLGKEARLELSWWNVSLSLRQGKPLIMSPPDMTIQSDAATSGGWGAHCQGWETGGPWSKEEMNLHINEQEMLAALLALKTFTKWKPAKSVLLQIDSQVALAYIAKQGGTKSPNLLAQAKEIWDYLELKQIELSVEWLPTELNVKADFQSRNVQDSAEWKLDPQIFLTIGEIWGPPSIDLFASRTSHQLPMYMSLKADPNATAIDALQQPWENMFPFAFPPFSLIGRVLKRLEQFPIKMILITPVWPSQPWYPSLLHMSIQRPLLLPVRHNLLLNPKGDSHPMLSPRLNLQLAAWQVSGEHCSQREFLEELLSSFAGSGEPAPRQTTTVLGGSSLAGSASGVQIPFDARLLGS